MCLDVLLPKTTTPFAWSIVSVVYLWSGFYVMDYLGQ